MTTITLSTAHDLVKKKILVNRISCDVLSKQIIAADSLIKIQEVFRHVCEEKKKLINEYTGILEQQLNNYDEFRQSQCFEICKELDALDVVGDEVVQYNLLYTEANAAVYSNLDKINAINATIPSELIVENYKIRVSSLDKTIDLLNEPMD